MECNTKSFNDSRNIIKNNFLFMSNEHFVDDSGDILTITGKQIVLLYVALIIQKAKNWRVKLMHAFIYYFLWISRTHLCVAILKMHRVV